MKKRARSYIYSRITKSRNLRIIDFWKRRSLAVLASMKTRLSDTSQRFALMDSRR